MMGENSLTFIPFDDPSKEVFEGVIENGYDGSNVAKLKGIGINNQIIMWAWHSSVLPCKRNILNFSCVIY